MNSSQSSPLRLITFDEQHIFLRGLNSIFEHDEDFTLMASTSSVEQLKSHLEHADANVLLMDYAISPQQGNGMNLIREFHQRYAQVSILVMSSFYCADVVAMALRYGARGFVSKQASEDELTNAVHMVGNGNLYLELEMAMMLAQLHHSEVQAKVPEDVIKHKRAAVQAHSQIHIPQAQLSNLSPKVQEVMLCLINGMTVTEIARKYSRSIKTISGQKQIGMRKLGIKTDIEFYLLRHGLSHGGKKA